MWTKTSSPPLSPDSLTISPGELAKLTQSATEARLGGVTLFTTTRHTAAAGLSYSGKMYRSAGGDDAAFHYRYPIGGLLQQAATERDYFLRAIVVVGEKGQWPVVNYRDRQYGFESSSFNHEAGKPPIALILTDGLGHYRATTFEDRPAPRFQHRQLHAPSRKRLPPLPRVHKLSTINVGPASCPE